MQEKVKSWRLGRDKVTRPERGSVVSASLVSRYEVGWPDGKGVYKVGSKCALVP